MYCSNCGKEIADNAVVCVHCGCATKNYQVNNSGQNKSMLCAILLWFFLGGFGAHRFYLGHNASAILMLLCVLFCWLIIPILIWGIWWIIDLFLLLTGSLIPKDGSKLI